MAGNAAEWVASYYEPYPGNNIGDENYGLRNRVVRGGHFRSDINDVRAAARYYSPPELNPAQEKRNPSLIGFRCAVSGDDPRLQRFLRSGSLNR